jgi:CHAT domain-containing protein
MVRKITGLFLLLGLAACGLVATVGCRGGLRPGALDAASSPLTPRSAFAPDTETSASRRIAAWVRAMNQPRRWTADPSHEREPDVSPDEQWMVYVSDAEGNDDLYLMSLPPALPSPPRLLADTPAREGCPRFSPDGRRIAYVSTLDDAFGDIWIVETRSGKTRRLTDRATRDSDPAWMPGGDALVVSCAAGESSPTLHRLDVKSGRLEPLASGPGTQPDVSPDGTLIAYITTSNDDERPVPHPRLAILDLHTGQIHYPTPGTVPEATPRFTRDGNAILLARGADDTNGDDRFDEADRWTVWRLERQTDREWRDAGPLTASDYDARHPAPFTGGFFFASDVVSRRGDLFSFDLEGAAGPRELAASEYFEAATALGRERPADEEALICAWRQLAAGRPAAATEDLRQRARLEEIRVLERLGRLGQAEQQAEALLEHVGPDSPVRGLAEVARERIILARVERATAQAARLRAARRVALARLEKIIRESDGHPEVATTARLSAARIAGELGELAKAVEATDTILARYGDQRDAAARALLLRGRLQERLNLPEEISRSYRRVISEYDDQRTETLEAARRILELLTRSAGTIEDQRRELNLLISDPSTPPLLAALAQNRIGDFDAAADRLADALRCYQRTIAEYPEQTEAVAAAHFAQSRVLYDQGRFEESVRVYERIEQRLRPRDDLFYIRARRGFIRQTLLKAEAEYRSNDPALARATFVSLLDYDPSIVEAWRGVLRSDAALGRIPEMVVELRESLRQSPDAPALRYAYGLALTYVPKREKQAESELRQAALLDPASPYPHQTLGYLHEQHMARSGDRDAGLQALKEYQLALALTDRELVPTNAAALLVNTGNAARLLGLWGLAGHYYNERARDPDGHEDPRTEYLFYRHYGETAFNAGNSIEAARVYAKALEILPIAREKDAGKTGVNWEEQETELMDRRALALQEAGRYEEAAALFGAVARRTKDPRAAALATRNRGVNLYFAARELHDPERTTQLREAWYAFADSRDSVERQGVITARERRGAARGLFGFTAVFGMGDEAGGAGMGFDLDGERRLLLGFQGWIAETDQNPESALEALRKQLEAFPKLTDANRAYILTEKAVLLSRVAALEEQQGRIAEAAQATLDSLNCCRWIAAKKESTNTRGAALAVMNLARLWAAHPESIPAQTRQSWAITGESEGGKKSKTPRPPDLPTEELIAQLLENVRRLLDVSPPPPAAVLLADVLFHQGMVELRRAEILLTAPTPEADSMAVLTQAAESLNHAQRARAFLAAAESRVVQTPAARIPVSPEDRERLRRVYVASLLRRGDALALLGRAEDSREATEKAAALAGAWRYDDLLFAHYFEQGLRIGDAQERERLWLKAVEIEEHSLPGDRSVTPAHQAARATLGAFLARRCAERDEWEEAWRWSEWAGARNLAAVFDAADPQLREGTEAELIAAMRLFRRNVRETITTTRRSTIALAEPPNPAARTQLDALAVRWTQWLDKARNDAPELWALVSGQPLPLGDIVDSLPADTATIRLAWIGNGALVIAYAAEELHGQVIEDADGRLAAILGVSADHRWEEAELAELAGRLWPALADWLPDVAAIEWFVDSVFAFVPLEWMPVEGKPAVERWEMTRLTSTALRYLCEKHRTLWRQRLLTLGEGAAPDEATGAAFDFRQTLGGNLEPREWMDAVAATDALRVRWTLELPAGNPAAVALTPPGKAATVPGRRLRAREFFGAEWSLSCAAFERASDSGRLSRADRHAALDFFLTALAWGGCPTIVTSPLYIKTTSTASGVDTPGPGAALAASALWKRYWDHFADKTAAGAWQSALRETRAAGISTPALAGYQLWGHPGLAGEAAALYAADEFEDRLGRAIAAHRRQDWKAAVQGFQRAYLLLERVEPDDQRLGEIAEILAEDANLAGEYRLGAQAALRLIERREKAGDSAQRRAAAWRLYGLLLARAGSGDLAVEAMRRAVELREQADDPLEFLKALGELGIVLENLARYDQALEIFGRARDFCAELEVPEEEAAQWRRMGLVLFLRLGRWGEAEEAFNRARELFAAAGDFRGEAEALLDLGMISERRAEFDKALRYYDNANTIALTLFDKAIEARAALNQANTHWLTGNYLECLQRQKHAAETAEAANQPLMQLAAYNTAGLLRWTLNEFDRALREFDSALELSVRLGIRSEEASTRNNQGLVWRSRADYPKALEHFLEALQIDRDSGNRWGQAYDYRNIGMTHLMAGDAPQAADYLRQAVRLSADLGEITNYAKAVLSLGDAERVLGDPDSARTNYDEALKAARERRLPEVEWRALQGLAALEQQAQRRPEAIARLREAIDVVERMRASIRVEELQDGFLADKQDLYEQLIILLLDENQVEESFELCERARGRSFIDLLGNQDIDLSSIADQRLIERERALRQEMERLETEMAATSDEARRAELLRTLQERRAALADLLVEIRTQNPALSAFVTVDPIRLEELYFLLGEDVTLIEYFLAEKETVIWVLRNGTIRAVRIPENRGQLIEQVTNYRRRIQAVEECETLSRELYDRLLRPAAPLLQGSQRLAIVPHNVLHYVSFASLSDRGEAMIDRHAMFYLPSASVFRYTAERRVVPRNTRVLAIGNPDLGDPALDLPFARKEAERIVWDFAEVDVLTGERATEAWVRENIEGYGIIHIASHGEFDSINPLFSAIMLAKDPVEDGNLTVREVFSLSVRADLVTLSACQSGLAQINNGDDLVGLNRAFVYAGTHALLASLWRVDDIATAVMIKHFYRNYADTDKAEALRRAQVQVRRFQPHPAYWAGLVLTGDWM